MYIDIISMLILQLGEASLQLQYHLGRRLLLDLELHRELFYLLGGFLLLLLVRL